ncbi:pyruvate/2-oxoglutarate dehydrogenase complex dihydrolipoamide dehydrogenase (E3) component [Rhodococcus sp. 27YEA15]
MAAPMASETHHSDVLVLGGGSGGYACAFRAGQLGLSVTLIEADKMGGTCLSQILQTHGGIKVIRAGNAGPVVGVHLVGDRVGELIGEAQLAVA